MSLLDSITNAIAQRKATAEQAQQQARSELHRILARSAKPKTGDDQRLIELADGLGVEPERLAVMVEVIGRAIELQTAGDDALLKRLALAAADASRAVNDFDDETAKIVAAREKDKQKLIDARGIANGSFSRAQDSLKSLIELASGEHAQLLQDVLSIKADQLPKPFHYYLNALNERDGKS